MKLSRLTAGRDIIVAGPGSRIFSGGDSAAKALPSLHQLKPAVGDFTGRGVILDGLLQKVRTGGGRTIAIRGMGGTGKTELAHLLCNQLQADFPEAQIETDLKGVSSHPVRPAEILTSILLAFEPVAHLPENDEELAGLLRSTLAGKRTLLLLDNARDAMQIKPLLPSPPGCLLVVDLAPAFSNAGRGDGGPRITGVG